MLADNLGLHWNSVVSHRPKDGSNGASQPDTTAALPVELRLTGTTTIDASNEFLNSYIKKFNGKFALPLNDIKSVLENQPPVEKTT